MVPRKFAEDFQERAELARCHHAPCEIVHDLKNCMTIVLLNFGNLELDCDDMGRKKSSIETLANIIKQMNRLVEELAELLGGRGR
jgi:hypothetical protein